jgi:hypothetical protein
MFLSTNNEIIIRIFLLRTLYCKMIKTFVFFIKNRNRSFDLSRLTRSYSRTICLRIWINSSNCDVMFFSCSSNSWSYYSLTNSCRENLSYYFLIRFVAKSMKIRKKCLISNALFFFWCWSFFISKKRLSSSWSKSWTMLLTNWWRIETRWEWFTIRSRNIIAFEFFKRVLFFIFFLDAFCISTIMQCVHDFRTFRTFYTFQWLTNRIRWCDVSWRIFRIRRWFDNVSLCVRIFDNWSIVVKCNSW